VQEPREISDPELRERMEAPSVVGEEDIIRKGTVGPAGVEQINEGDERLVPLAASPVPAATEFRGRTSFEIAGEPRDRGHLALLGATVVFACALSTGWREQIVPLLSEV